MQPTPRWDLHADTVVLNINHYTLLQQAVLNVKGVPMLYLPFMYYPTKKDDRATGFLLPTYGSSTLRGQSIHNAFFWAIDRSQDATFLHDWFSKTGQGVGSEYRYNFGGGSDGERSGYFARSSTRRPTRPRRLVTTLPASELRTCTARPTRCCPADMRARGQRRLLLQLHDARRLQHEHLRRVAQPALVRRQRHRRLGHLFAERARSTTPSTSTTQTEFDRHRRRAAHQVSRNERPLFPASQLYFAATGEYAHLDQRSEATDRPDAAIDTNNGLNRLDFAPQIRYPFKKWQLFTVNSSLAWHDTFYTRSYDRPSTRALAPDLSRSARA